MPNQRIAETKHMKKKSTKSKTKFPVVVNRTFLLDLAARIYNPKTKSFLRLCDGKLQNGPDPEDAERPMHCGLGELYFAMTGRHPKQDHVDEDAVIQKVVSLSTLTPYKKSELNVVESAVVKALSDLKLPSHLRTDVRDTLIISAAVGVTDTLRSYYQRSHRFHEVLNEIASENDDGCGTDLHCNSAVFRKRSMRVAKTLRAAASLLPKDS